MSKERKELWGVELDLLWQFKNICDKYHLKHYLDGGTLLGAVRHGGFIPWDDDIDIAMPRTDYDRFLECAVKELNYPYFVQNDWTDSTFYCCTKLRRSDTTCIHKKDLEGHFTFNQGIFIDICPFDNVPDDLVERQKFMHQLHLIKLEALAVKQEYNVMILLRKTHLDFYILEKNIKSYDNDIMYSPQSHLVILHFQIRYKVLETLETITIRFTLNLSEECFLLQKYI